MSLALAENPRTAVKAAIKRATQAGQRDMRRLDRRTLSELEQRYRQAAAALEVAIRRYAGTDGSLRLEVMQELLAQVYQQLDALAISRNQLLNAAAVQAASIGTAPFTGASVSGGLTRVADDALRFSRTFVAEDGLQLADRIWRIDRGARERVAEAIQTSIIQGHSASQAATEFLARAEPVPADIAAKVGLSNAERVAARAGRALLQDEGNARANALRLFRTELNRAHGEAFQRAAFAVDGVVGTRFLLSPAHPEPDICDMHARVNRYGLGPGVYPPGKSPWPAHPNTLSFEVAVFADEVTDDDRAEKEDRITWLRRQDPTVQAAVLGSRQKISALRQGVLTEGQIKTPWRVLKKRYASQGIDIGRASGNE